MSQKSDYRGTLSSVPILEVDYLVCGLCQKDFPLANIVSFMQHKKFDCDELRDCQGLKSRILLCQSCPRKFSTPWRLLQHAQSVHSLCIYFENFDPGINHGTVGHFHKPDSATPGLSASDMSFLEECLKPSSSQALRTSAAIIQKDLLDQHNYSLKLHSEHMSPINQANILPESVTNKGHIDACQINLEPLQLNYLPSELIELNDSKITNQENDSQDLLLPTVQIGTDRESLSPQVKIEKKDVERQTHNKTMIAKRSLSKRQSTFQKQQKKENEDDGQICCDNQDCGITLMPGTHEELKKCCNAVIPKKRKRHMETKHMSASEKGKRRSNNTGDRHKARKSSVKTVLINKEVINSADSSRPKNHLADHRINNITLNQDIFHQNEPQNEVHSNDIDDESSNQDFIDDYEDNKSNIQIFPLKQVQSIINNNVVGASGDNIRNNHHSVVISEPVTNSSNQITCVPVPTPLNSTYITAKKKEKIKDNTYKNGDIDENDVLGLLGVQQHDKSSLCNHDNLAIHTNHSASISKPPDVVLPECLSNNRHDDVYINQGLSFRKRRYPTSKPFKCDQCQQAFNQRIHLKKHLSKHTGVKPFQCDQCDYSTVEKSHLKVHIRVHTGEKPFKCNFCEYATAQNSTLKIHLRRHHQATEGVRCLQCKREFSEPECLTNHNKTEHQTPLKIVTLIPNNNNNTTNTQETAGEQHPSLKLHSSGAKEEGFHNFAFMPEDGSCVPTNSITKELSPVVVNSVSSINKNLQNPGTTHTQTSGGVLNVVTSEGLIVSSVDSNQLMNSAVNTNLKMEPQNQYGFSTKASAGLTNNTKDRAIREDTLNNIHIASKPAEHLNNRTLASNVHTRPISCILEAGIVSNHVLSCDASKLGPIQSLSVVNNINNSSVSSDSKLTNVNLDISNNDNVANISNNDHMANINNIAHMISNNKMLHNVKIENIPNTTASMLNNNIFSGTKMGNCKRLCESNADGISNIESVISTTNVNVLGYVEVGNRASSVMLQNVNTACITENGQVSGSNLNSQFSLSGNLNLENKNSSDNFFTTENVQTGNRTDFDNQFMSGNVNTGNKNKTNINNILGNIPRLPNSMYLNHNVPANAYALPSDLVSVEIYSTQNDVNVTSSSNFFPNTVMPSKVDVIVETGETSSSTNNIILDNNIVSFVDHVETI